MAEKFRTAVRDLREAQKSSRGAAAYSRFINRPIGRLYAAAAYTLGLSPNTVTAISAAVTFSGIAVLILVEPTWWSSLAISFLLVNGYALDSADGQVARLMKKSSVDGEWLDHMVDALKMGTIHTAVLVSWYRFGDFPRVWLAVPLVFQVTASVFFFGLILSDLLRRIQSLSEPSAVQRRKDDSSAPSTLYALAVLPSDYGFLCLVFLTLWIQPVFRGIYTVIAILNIALLSAAIGRWFRDMKAFR